MCTNHSTFHCLYPHYPNPNRIPNPMPTITRVPRPLGVTLQARSLHNLSNPQQKQKEINKIKHHILNQYFINQQTINNKFYTIDQVAKYLQLTNIEVLRYMTNRLGYLQGFSTASKEDLLGGLRALAGSAIFGALSHSQTADYQLRTLLNAQGGKYVPYLTEQVNKAISNAFQSDKNLGELARNLLGMLPTNRSPFEVSGPEETEDRMTTDKALKLMSQTESTKLLGNPQTQAEVYHANGLDAMPEVRANFQTADDLKQPTDHHTDRRERTEGYIDKDQM